MKNLILLLLFSFSLLASVGKITYLKGDVTLTNANVVKTDIEVGTPINKGDTTTTEQSSVVKIVFDDLTLVAVGSRSDFSVEEYLFDEQSDKNRALFSAKKGIFKMLTGKIGKLAPKKFKLKTETSTIGIRGTIFSAILEKNQEIFICDKGEICVKSVGVSQNIKAGYSSTVIKGKGPRKPIKTPQSHKNRVKKSTTS
jgi:hypothetical protein